MKIIGIYIAWVLSFLLGSCNQSTRVNGAKHFDFVGYFTSQIDTLNALKPGYEKTVFQNENPVEVSKDSIDWKAELALFLTLDINSPRLVDQYRESSDSTGDISIHEYLALDSNLAISRISITRVKSDIQLIEATLKKRSFIVDRDIELSYQPLKGYSVKITEDYLWGGVQKQEVFNELDGPGFLKN